MNIINTSIKTSLTPQDLAPLPLGNRQLSTFISLDALLHEFIGNLNHFIKQRPLDDHNTSSTMLALVVQQCTTKGDQQENTLVVLIPRNQYHLFAPNLKALGMNKQIGITVFQFIASATQPAIIQMKKINGGKTIGLLNWMNNVAKTHKLPIKFIPKKRVVASMAPTG